MGCFRAQHVPSLCVRVSVCVCVSVCGCILTNNQILRSAAVGCFSSNKCRASVCVVVCVLCVFVFVFACRYILTPQKKNQVCDGGLLFQIACAGLLWQVIVRIRCVCVCVSV